MTRAIYQAMESYLPYQGDKYISPAKAGPLASQMEDLRKKGQTARHAFTQIAQVLAHHLAGFQLEPTSQWMNQAQVIRPHFWAYLREENRAPDQPALALRLLADRPRLGISLEVSCIERKKSDRTLFLQNQVLTVAPQGELYYFAQRDGISDRLEMTEGNRLFLLEAVRAGQVRKVQVKFDVPDLALYQTLPDLLAELKRGWDLLQPYYQATLMDKRIF